MVCFQEALERLCNASGIKINWHKLSGFGWAREGLPDGHRAHGHWMCSFDGCLQALRYGIWDAR